jgi:hypothetical protein
MKCTQRIVDHGYAAILTELKKADNLYVKVGFPLEGNPGYPSKHAIGPLTKEEASTMNKITIIASTHEFGSEKRNIPERSFIRSTFDAEYENLQAFKEREYLRILQGKQTANTAIGRVGEWLTNKTKAFIRNRIPPPLKKATIKRKGSSVPLIDTAQMINSIQWSITNTRS